MPTFEQPEDQFGFLAVKNSVKDRIRQIRPSVSQEPPPNIADIDAAAENVGFVSREAPVHAEYAYRSRKAVREPTIALNMRAPVSLADGFKGFCDENRYSYPEGLAEIMRRAGLFAPR